MRANIRAVVATLFAAVASAASLPARAITSVCTPEQLAAVADDLAGSYALGADIDLGGADWTPIGNNSAPFTGSLHGNGHAIRNLVCTNSLSGSDYRGLFGCVSNATIEGDRKSVV